MTVQYIRKIRLEGEFRTLSLLRFTHQIPEMIYVITLSCNFANIWEESSGFRKCFISGSSRPSPQSTFLLFPQQSIFQCTSFYNMKSFRRSAVYIERKFLVSPHMIHLSRPVNGIPPSFQSIIKYFNPSAFHLPYSSIYIARPPNTELRCLVKEVPRTSGLAE
jgi:hypothetical protein